MTNLFDALEFCLQEMERGAEIESVLARFPEHAEELRPILKTAAKAQKMAVASPETDVVRRSRAKVMQHAAELREARVAPTRSRSGIPLFQRLVISFGLAAFFLMSGSGLLSASASALPGEQLYPVKRGWENVRLFFIFDSEARELLKDEFENERLHEVNELLAEGRDEVIEFAGVFMQVNGVAYVSGLQVILPQGMAVPANGEAVIVSGQTNAQGFVEIISLQVLPAGSVVPVGNPIEMESESAEETAPSSATNPGAEGEATASAPAQYEVNGILREISLTTLVIDGMTVYLDNYSIEQTLCVGMEIEVKGYYAADGRFVVVEVKGKGECSSGGTPSGSNSNSSSGSDSNSNSSNGGNSNSDDSNAGNSNDDDSNDDDSNDDSGGDDDNSGGGDDDND